MNQTIEYIIKDVYGKPLMYIVSEHAEAVTLLTKRASLSDSDMTQLRKLGFDFEQVIR